jgi:hypothetical protein
MKDRTVKVRLLLPSGIKELEGPAEEVIAEMLRLTQLESDMGPSYAEGWETK